MKIKEIRELTEAELILKEKEIRNSIFNIRTQMQLGRAETPFQIRKIKRDIAKIKTVLNEKKGK